MNDFDIWQKELRKIDLTTAVAPVVRGVMLVEDSQVEAYNKIQKLLNCPELESSHRFLYNLDPTELTEAEATKVANLYQLGVDRGFIAPEQDDEEDDETPDQGSSEETAGTEQKEAPQPPVQSELPATVPQAAYTVLYSAMRNGQIKSGEAFSNSVNTRSAKADVISKLERAGYSNISILAIEAGDPDAQGDCSNTYVKMPDNTIPDYSVEDEENVAEDDMLNGRVHNGHVAEDDNVEEDDLLNGRQHNGHIEEEDAKDDGDSSDAAKDDAESKDDGKSDEKKDDADDAAGADDAEKEDQKKEDPEEPDEKLKGGDDGDKEDEEKELSNEEKGPLKDAYKKAFKAALQKCKFTTSFSELSLEQKVDFFTVLSKAWSKKPDPSKFMSDKELEQLEKIVVKNP